VRGLADAVENGRGTVASIRRVTERAESLLDDLEAPLRALAPGLTRLAGVLDEPIIGAIPEILEAIRNEARRCSAG